VGVEFEDVSVVVVVVEVVVVAVVGKSVDLTDDDVVADALEVLRLFESCDCCEDCSEACVDFSDETGVGEACCG